MLKEKINIEEGRPYIAVASQQGLFVNLKLDEATVIRVYQADSKRPKLIDLRDIPGKDKMCRQGWRRLGHILKDCSCLFVQEVSEIPYSVLTETGLKIYEVEDFVDKILIRIAKGKNIQYFNSREPVVDTGEDNKEKDDKFDFISFF